MPLRRTHLFALLLGIFMCLPNKGVSTCVVGIKFTTTGILVVGRSDCLRFGVRTCLGRQWSYSGRNGRWRWRVSVMRRYKWTVSAAAQIRILRIALRSLPPRPFREHSQSAHKLSMCIYFGAGTHYDTGQDYPYYLRSAKDTPKMNGGRFQFVWEERRLSEIW